MADKQEEAGAQLYTQLIDLINKYALEEQLLKSVILSALLCTLEDFLCAAFSDEPKEVFNETEVLIKELIQNATIRIDTKEGAQ